MLIDIASITVPPERQRKDLGNIDELAESIRLRGLINPITVDYNSADEAPEVVLIAGERRLRACKKLGWTHISCRPYTSLTLRERELIELEENAKRKDLTWQERAAAVARLYRLHDEDITKVAESLGYSTSSNNMSTILRELVEVAAELEAGNEQVAASQNASSALGIIRRQRERSREAAVDDIDSILRGNPANALADLLDDRPAASVAASIAPKDTKASILVADFVQWAPAYEGTRFNLLHCDFPYGVGMDKSDQGKAVEYGSYADDEATYWTLVQTLCGCQDRLMTPDAHVLFWFSMKYYADTVDAFEKSGFRVNPFPLIWMKSDNRGILPDANRGPRQIYETALLITRGDRKIVRAVSNSIAHPLGEKQHQSQKPAAVMRYYLGMLVDGTTRLLDPTCGSGTAVAAASELGAASALGLEINPEYARIAEANVRALDATEILAAAG